MQEGRGTKTKRWEPGVFGSGEVRSEERREGRGVKREKDKRSGTRGLPMWSPTIVLTPLVDT